MISENFMFCNTEFLQCFNDDPSPFYFLFLDEKNNLEALKIMGNKQNVKVDFRYDNAKKIRATFFTFVDAKAHLDTKCIALVFDGSKKEAYCYFFEIYEDNSIGCIQVSSPKFKNRMVMKLYVNENIDEYFSLITSFFTEGKNKEKRTALFYIPDHKTFSLREFPLNELLEIHMPYQNKDFGDVKYKVFAFDEDNLLYIHLNSDSSYGDITLEDYDTIKLSLINS